MSQCSLSIQQTSLTWAAHEIIGLRTCVCDIQPELSGQGFRRELLRVVVVLADEQQGLPEGDLAPDRHGGLSVTGHSLFDITAILGQAPAFTL